MRHTPSGHVPIDISVFEINMLSEVNSLELAYLVFVVISSVRVRPDKNVVVVFLFEYDRTVLHRAANVNVGFDYSPLTQMWIFLLDKTCGMSCRELIVVKKPDLHIAFFCFAQNNVHISPPAIAAKIRVRARFNADSPASAFENSVDLLWYFLGVVTSLPIKWKKIIVLLSV